MACMEVALKSSIRNSFLISNMHSGPQVFLWNHKEQVTSLWQTFKQIEECMVLPLRVLCPFLPLPLSLLSSCFLVAPSLYCYARTFSSCADREFLSVGGGQASHCTGFLCCGAQVPGAQASAVAAHGLSSCGTQA